METEYIWLAIIVLLVLNAGIFLFLLIRKVARKAVNRKKANIRKGYEADFLQFVTDEESQLTITPRTYLEKSVVQSLIIDYNSFVSGKKRTILLEKAGKRAIHLKAERYLSSSNPWKNKTGTYLAGEFDLNNLSPLLLKQLKTSDRELFYVTARSLVKIGDGAYLREILEEAAKEDRITKRNVLSLLELVEGDISDILEESMRSGKRFLQVIALEELAKRQYEESVKWIKAMILHPQKELRIAALKAGHTLGNIGEAQYLSQIMSLKKDSQWEVRAFLAKFLSKVHHEQAIRILKELIRDQNWLVRRNAAEALLAHDEKGQNALMDLLESDDPYASDAAEAVLQREALYL